MVICLACVIYNSWMEEREVGVGGFDIGGWVGRLIFLVS